MTTLPRYTSLKQTKPLRRQSAKARRLNTPRQKCLAIVRQRSHGYCEARAPGCTFKGQHGHEKLSRARGGDITDPANVIWVCPECHDWIHRAPVAATAAGLLVASWDKTRETE